MSAKFRNVCFTSYKVENYDGCLRDLESNEVVKYLVVGKEVCPKTNRPHLQGYMELNSQQRLGAIKTLLGDPAVHIENRRGTAKEASDYCKKENTWFEIGEMKIAGKRKDIDVIIEWLDDFIATNQRAPNAQEVARQRPDAFLKYKNFMQLANLRAPDVVLQTGEARGWQVDLEKALILDCTDDRQILFYVDMLGASGKSWFQRYYFSKWQETTQLLKPGPYADMAYTLDESKNVFLINVARGGMEFLQYRFLEDLKDRLVFSTKYESRNKILRKTPHIVVFCNEMPDQTKMTNDRFKIIELDRAALIPAGMEL